jgi:hypothetical protein
MTATVEAAGNGPLLARQEPLAACLSLPAVVTGRPAVTVGWGDWAARVLGSLNSGCLRIPGRPLVFLECKFVTIPTRCRSRHGLPRGV